MRREREDSNVFRTADEKNLTKRKILHKKLLSFHNIKERHLINLILYTSSVRKVSGLPLYLRAIVFERPLRGMNVNSKAS